MSSIIFSLFTIYLLSFTSVITKRRANEIDQIVTPKPLLNKYVLASNNEDKQEYVQALDTQQRLDPIQLKEHCILESNRIGGMHRSLEQCLLGSSDHDQIKQHSLRAVLEPKEDANQFLHTFQRRKRLIYFV